MYSTSLVENSSDYSQKETIELLCFPDPKLRKKSKDIIFEELYGILENYTIYQDKPDLDYSDNGDSFERKTLSYQAMIPYLVKAIQELSAKVTALENA